LKASFFELDNGEVMAIFEGKDHHQSYPNRLHGGISSTILDETIGRAIMIDDPKLFGVTVELVLKYKKPVPLNEPLRVVGRIVKKTRRTFEGTGEILLADGTVAVTASGKYMIMAIDKIMTNGDSLDWDVVSQIDDPKTFEY
jgi:acyl-coenzyme A thioesterase PaaI-like protein